MTSKNRPAEVTTGGALAEFWQFARDFQTVPAWVAKAAVAAPLLDILLSLGPPWPNRISVAVAVCVVEMVILMYSFEFWRRGAPAIVDVRRVLRRATLLLALIFAGYAYVYASFVEEGEDAWDRVAIGYRLQPHVAELIASDPVKYTPRQLILDFHDPKSIWTSQSVNTIRWFLLVGWLSFWACLSVVISAFVAIQWRRLAHHAPTEQVKVPTERALSGRQERHFFL
jgi:hypothetical protein